MKKLMSALLSAVMLISLCACTKTEKETAEKAPAIEHSTDDSAGDKVKKETSDGIISVFSYKPDTLCPILSNNNANVQMLKLIFDSLIIPGDDMRPQAKLATEWSVGDSGRDWHITLRGNVFWHDSAPFTSEDVVYTVKSIIAHSESPYAANTANIASVKAEGTNKVTFTLKEPDPCFINMLNFPIIKNGSIGADLRDFSPTGTGAYIFEDRNEGNVYYLSANPHFYSGAPKNKLIRVRMLPDKDTALYAFGSDNIDIAAADNTDWGKYVDSAEASHTPIKTPIYHFIGLNNRNALLSDNGVRTAISYAVNRKEICETVFLGSGTEANAPIRSEWYVFGNQGGEHLRDTNAARKELEACGWELADNKTYQKKVGRKKVKLKLNLLINEDNADRENLSQIIENNLEELGMEINIVKTSFEDYEKRIASGKYDMFLGSYTVPANMDLSFLLGEGNVFGFADEELDFVINTLKTKKDSDGIIESYAEVINLFEQLNPVIGLAFQNRVLVYSNSIEGDVTPNYYNIYNGIENLTKN